MKSTNIKNNKGLRFSLRALAFVVMGIFAIAGMSAQNSLPAPGSGGSYRPAPVGGGVRPGPGFGHNGIGWNPGPGWGRPNMGWNNGWSTGWNGSWNLAPSYVNQATTNVVACGYDASGIWRTIPLLVTYYYNGFEYEVTVINAWNPWSQTWNMGVDMPAYNTSININGENYDFYAPLSTGTYYFNL